MSHLHKILAAVDFSPLSDEIVSQVATVAKAFGASVVLVHAAAPDPAFVGYDVGPQHVRDARAKGLHEEHRDLHARAEHLRSQGIETEAILVQGPTVATILEVASRSSVGMLVIGSHGRGAALRALLGSVSTEIIRHSAIPVLVVPMPGRGQGRS